LGRIWKQYGGHPNIVKFVDWGNERRYPVLVEEYVPGQTLAEYVASKGGLDPDETFEIGRKLADVLRFLHSHGIIHRYLAADIVIIREADKEPVVDLGIEEFYARIISELNTAATPCWMPPDRSISGNLYSSSDVYMWAATLMSVMKPRRCYFTDVYVNFCSYIDYRYALADEPCNLVKCGGYVALFNKVFKAALEVDPTKRVKDGAELYSLLTGNAAYDPITEMLTKQPANRLRGLSSAKHVVRRRLKIICHQFRAPWRGRKLALPTCCPL